MSTKYFFDSSNHPKIRRALERYGEEKFEEDAKNLLKIFPRCNIVLGLLGGPSTGRYGFKHTAGKKFSRPAVRYERNNGIVGIRFHSGPYLYISI